MVTAARVGPRWIDPDRVWAGSGPGSVTSAEEMVASEGCQIDRFHNHENMSPEALGTGCRPAAGVAGGHDRSGCDAGSR